MAQKSRSGRLILLGVGLMVLALVASAGLLLLYLTGDDDPDGEGERVLAPTVPPVGAVTATAYVPPTTPLPDTPTPWPTVTPQPTLPPVDWTRPTAAPDVIASALDRPALNAVTTSVQRHIEPLTIIPARERNTVITYTVQRGDNLSEIAARFGLDENTIIWSNDRFYVNAMRVGLKLNILPVDGVYHRVQEPQTVAQVAEQYDVEPYAIIDSEYNSLFGVEPQTILPVGLYVVVPGGTGSTEPIYWDPGIVITTDGSSPVGTGVNAGATVASFAEGDPGSCGRQPVIGGTAPTTAPIWRNYRITQDYSWNHGGIDLAVPEGTPVYAAGGGTVIFAGMSTWGYGYTVVIAHGGTLSLYGHLNGAFVSCGQVVEAGQNIAVSGNSGRSSGPHLHFEIRGPGGAPDNPWNWQSF